MLCSLLAVPRLLPTSLATAAALAGVAFGLGARTTSASAGQPSVASQLLSDALNAAQQAGSMQFVDKTTADKSVQILEGVISAPTAGETLHSSEPLQVELISGTIYVIGSTNALQSSLQITAEQATPYAGKWIAVSSTDAPFQLLASDLTLGATIDVFTPGQGGLRMGKVRTVGGQRVIPIYGRPSNLPAGTAGSAALFVSTIAPHLPMGGTLVLKNKTGGLNEVSVFKNWGSRVQLTAPTGATPFSTVLG